MGWLTILLYALFALGALGMAWAATGAVLTVLTKRAILDHPNERSSHETPTNSADRGCIDRFTQI